MNITPLKIPSEAENELTFLAFLFPPTARRRHMQVRGSVVRAERSHAGQERQTL